MGEAVSSQPPAVNMAATGCLAPTPSRAQRWSRAYRRLARNPLVWSGSVVAVLFVGAGGSGGACLGLEASLDIRAVVALSPVVAPGRQAKMRAPNVAKLLLVGTLDADAQAAARAIHHIAAGWVVLSAIPVAEQGMALLRSAWSAHVREQIIIFLRDYAA